MREEVGELPPKLDGSHFIDDDDDMDFDEDQYDAPTVVIDTSVDDKDIAQQYRDLPDV